MRLLKNLCLTMIFLTLGCGSEPQTRRPSSEFSMEQNPNELNYAIQNIQFQARVGLQNGNEIRFDQSLGDRSRVTSETIVRKPIAGGYVLEINDQPSRLRVSLAGAIVGDPKEKDEAKGCSYFVDLKTKGQASHDRFELIFDLNGKVEGEDCPDDIYSDFYDRIEKDLSRLPFHFLSKIRSSDLLELSASKDVKISIRVTGAVY